MVGEPALITLCSEVDVTQQQSALVLSGQIDCLTCHVWEAGHMASQVVSLYSTHPACLRLCCPLDSEVVVHGVKGSLVI